MDDRSALREALMNAHDRRPPLVSHPWDNCAALVAACTADNVRLTKLLVAKGYRLRSTHFAPPPDGKEVWTGLPFKPPTKARAAYDEIKQLHVLRAMSRPCYIFCCYQAVSEAAKVGKHEAECFNSACDCHGGVTRPFERSPSPVGGFNGVMAGQVTSDHHCPDSPKFTPKYGCTDHPACNDPIFRCFEITKVASEWASRVPEYREEYQQVADETSRHAVDLLDLCADTGEVEVLLEERTGTLSYFHSIALKKLRYPRLQMAIINNHKSFVGHMYCQQLLRSQWQGNVPWQEKSFFFRFTYIGAQCLMTPWWILISLLRLVLFDLKVTRERWKKASLPDSVFDYICGPNNLDEPINRFFAYTEFYVFFLILITLCVFSPVVDGDELRNNFHWYHDLLFVMTTSMIVNGIATVFSVRALSPTNKFWALYDILMQVTLTAAFIARSLMGKIHECKNGQCDRITLEARIPFDTFSNCLLAVAAVLAITRLLYWFQLHDRVGPIVINLSRVVTDVLTFLTFFFVLVSAYTIAMVPLRAMNSRCDNFTAYLDPDNPAFNEEWKFDPPLDEDNCWAVWDPDLFMYILKDMVSLIFWGILNPEKPEVFNTETADGVIALIVFAIYCVFIIIILLNLLIAVMNATIQKVNDRKHLYWKFVRTSIWIEYFGETYELPPPFSMYLVARRVAKGIYKRVMQRVRHGRASTKVSVSPSFLAGCSISQSTSLRRTMTLLGRRRWSNIVPC